MRKKLFMAAYLGIPNMRICARFTDRDGRQELFFAGSDFNYFLKDEAIVKTCLVFILRSGHHFQEIKNLLHDITFEILFDDINFANQVDNLEEKFYKEPVIEVNGNIQEDGSEADIAFDRLKASDYCPCNIGVYPVISV